MNKLLFFPIIFFVAISSIGQNNLAEFGKLNEKSTYFRYISKTGDTLQVGDTLTIGLPTSGQGFVYISQGGQKTTPDLSGKNIIIDKLKVYGSKSKGYKMYAQFKGYGLPVLIDYETAIEVGEVINSNANLTREEAMAKLKEAKDLLELELITQEEYDKMKEELTPIILDK